MSVLKVNQIQTANGVIMANLNSSGANVGIQLAPTLAPAFHASMTGHQVVSNATYTKVRANTEIFDTANCYDPTTNYRFTPTVAGYYQVNATCANDSVTQNPTFARCSIYKNGAIYATSTMSASGSASNTLSPTVSVIMYMNGSSDYIEMYGFNGGGAGTPLFYYNESGGYYTHFSAALIRSA
jgi:hypothetical protein